MIDRRTLMLASGALTLTASSSRLLAQATDPLGAIAEETGGRLGVAAMDTATGRRLTIDAGGIYPLCSTFKIILAAAILQRVDRGELDLAKPVRFGEFDLLDHAPVVRANIARGELPIATLCQAIIEVSDNSAANLLLPQVGGPRGLTRFIRDAGDPVTRLDRDEPTLNIFRADDPRDTTMPYAMLLLMREVLLGNSLTPVSRERLIGWMVASQTGLTRLRAGLPKGWRVGDKTGTSGAGQVNDVAIVWPGADRKPLLISCYLDSPELDPVQADAAIAKVGALVGALFARA